MYLRAEGEGPQLHPRGPESSVERVDVPRAAAAAHADRDQRRVGRVREHGDGAAVVGVARGARADDGAELALGRRRDREHAELAADEADREVLAARVERERRRGELEPRAREAPRAAGAGARRRAGDAPRARAAARAAARRPHAQLSLIHI